jgi:hypothetical protein
MIFSFRAVIEGKHGIEALFMFSMLIYSMLLIVEDHS